MTDVGSHTLICIEGDNGAIEVAVSLFGLLLYRVTVTERQLKNCSKNYMYNELRIDSSRKEIVHHSYKEAEQEWLEIIAHSSFDHAGVIDGVSIMVANDEANSTDVLTYPMLFNITKYLSFSHSDATGPNEIVNQIFHDRLIGIIQSSTLQKKSLKRFVNDYFFPGHTSVTINREASNPRLIIKLYAVFLIGMRAPKELNDKLLKEILLAGLPCSANGEFIVDKDLEQQLKNVILEQSDYSQILEAGAEIIREMQ